MYKNASTPSNNTALWLSLSLICSKFYHLFLPALPKNFTHYSYLILISLPIIPILFFCINVSGMYWHLEKQELDYVLVFCRYIVQILVIQVKWSIKVILKLIHLSCHCLPLILITNRYQLFFHYAFECPINIILKLCLWVSYNSQNYLCKISHL